VARVGAVRWIEGFEAEHMGAKESGFLFERHKVRLHRSEALENAQGRYRDHRLGRAGAYDLDRSVAAQIVHADAVDEIVYGDTEDVRCGLGAGPKPDCAESRFLSPLMPTLVEPTGGGAGDNDDARSSRRIA
jgi:hypothetical protein